MPFGTWFVVGGHQRSQSHFIKSVCHCRLRWDRLQMDGTELDAKLLCGRTFYRELSTGRRKWVWLCRDVHVVWESFSVGKSYDDSFVSFFGFLIQSSSLRCWAIQTANNYACRLSSWNHNSTFAFPPSNFPESNCVENLSELNFAEERKRP